MHLALPRLVLRELPIPFRNSLRRVPARARLLAGFGFGCAARRSGTSRCSGRPRRRRAAAAPRRMKNGLCPRQRTAACTCTADGRRRTRRGALIGRFAASANGAPVAVLGVHVGVGIDERSDDSAIAVPRRIVQRGVAIAVHGGAGVRGWAPRGYPSTQPVPRNKTARSPRGSTMCSFWVTVNDREYSRGLGVLAISHPARASIKRGKLRKSRKRRLRAKEAARNCETRQYRRGAYESRNVTSLPSRRSASTKMPEWCLT